MSEIIASIPRQEYIERIERTIISPKGNGEKVSESTSHLVHLTGEKCFNCLSSEGTGEKGDHYSVRNCENPKSPLKGSGNSASNSCSHHE